MMDSGPLRNMLSTLSNKYDKQCIPLVFIIRIHHDARSSECQKQKYLGTGGSVKDTQNTGQKGKVHLEENGVDGMMQLVCT